MELSCDICVIGGGVAGSFVATKFLKIGKKVALIDAHEKIGGQALLYQEKHINNIPMIENITASDLCKRLENDLFEKENFHFFSEAEVNEILKVDEETFNIFLKYKAKKDVKITSQYIIFATGKGKGIPNKLPLLQDISECDGKSVFYSVANKELFEGKKVLITGGGDSVIDWAVELSGIANEIIAVSRRQIVKVENQQFKQFLELVNSGKIVQKFLCAVKEIKHHNGFAEEVIIQNNENGSEEVVKCEMVLAFLGIKFVQSDILSKCANFDLISENGYIKVSMFNAQTNEKNIFAVGDCCYYEGKMQNIPFGFFECLKCFYEICKREDKNFNVFEKR